MVSVSCQTRLLHCSPHPTPTLAFSWMHWMQRIPISSEGVRGFCCSLPCKCHETARNHGNLRWTQLESNYERRQIVQSRRPTVITGCAEAPGLDKGPAVSGGLGLLFGIQLLSSGSISPPWGERSRQS